MEVQGPPGPRGGSVQRQAKRDSVVLINYS